MPLTKNTGTSSHLRRPRQARRNGQRRAVVRQVRVPGERGTPAEWTGGEPGEIALLAGSHVVDDIYQGAVPALLPFFIADRHYNYAAAAGLTFAATALSSVIQPVFGVLTDHRNLGSR